MPKWLIVLLVILGVFLLLGFLIYWKFWGITKKQKYARCANTCEELMLLESSIPVCKAKCTEITKYDPTFEIKQKAANSTKSESSGESQSSDAKYDCNYVWPQQIVEKSSGNLTLACPSSRPWCRPGEGTREDVSCCSDYSETTKEKTDCLKLPELEKGNQ